MGPLWFPTGFHSPHVFTSSCCVVFEKQFNWEACLEASILLKYGLFIETMVSRDWYRSHEMTRKDQGGSGEYIYIGSSRAAYVIPSLARSLHSRLSVRTRCAPLAD